MSLPRRRSETAAHAPRTLAAVVWGALCLTAPAAAVTTWGDYGGNPQHTAVSSVASQSLNQIVWQAPVDLNPQYSGNTLLIHYGCPLVSASNIIVIPVKTGVADSFRVEARNGGNGALLWQFDSDYHLPVHSWTPSFGPTLTPAGKLYMPGVGGTVFVIDDVETMNLAAPTRVAFYGIANYNANPSSYATDVIICTPLTSDSQGNVFFGYRGTGANPSGLMGGIVRMGADGSMTTVSALAATGGLGGNVLMNCAPALSNDGLTLYIAIRKPTNSQGYLVALDATTLATRYQVLLVDPKTGVLSALANDGTASPMVGPDGRIYFGVLDRPFSSNAARGWLLQFNPDLTLAGAPGAFGWDDTPSVVPASMVPSYVGFSSYLLMAKYNFYAGAGGDGINKLAILDPSDTQVDYYTGATVMKEILTIAGVTPDSAQFPTYPNAVREWCINTAAVDPATHSVLAGSEDGILYRWDLHTNTFTESVVLTPGIGEAYTPTLIGNDGRVYAINNATLFSVGNGTLSAAPPVERVRPALALAMAHPNPFTEATLLRYSVPRAARVRLTILDATGRLVANLVDGQRPAGEHVARWEGRDANGRLQAAGIYFAHLSDGTLSVSRRVVFTH